MTFRKTIMVAACAMGLSCLALGDSSFKFKPVVRTGDAAPVPAQLSSVLEFSFNDQAQIALSGDGGLILQSGSQTIPIAAPGDTGPGGGLFFSVDAPAVSPQGQVAFRGNVTFPGTSGLYTFSNGTISLLIPDGTLASDGESVQPGAAMFTSGGDMIVADFGGTLFVFSNGVLDRLLGPGDPVPGGTVSLVLGAAVNQSHQVAFQAVTSTGTDGIFLLSGGTISKIVASGDIMPDGVPFGFATAPTINDSGQVVFSGISNSIQDSGIFSFVNGQLSVIVPRLALLPNGGLLSFPFTTSLNNAGEIAFSASDLSDNQGVFLFANGQISQLEDTGQAAPEGGTFNNFVEVGATINNSGQVLLIAGRAQHGDALYLFSNDQLSRVIGQGDTIPRQPLFEFPTSVSIGGGDLVQISDSTFPGGDGAYTASPTGKDNLGVHVGEAIGSDGVVNLLFAAAMNQSGQIAASVSSSDARGALLLNSANTLTVVADSSPSSAVDPSGLVAIDDLGEIAFSAVNPSTFAQGLYLIASGQTQLLLDERAQLPQGTTVTNLALNNQHTLAFQATTFSPTFTTNVELFANGQLTTVAASGSPAPGGGTFQIFFDSPREGPVIDNRGDVAFASSLTGIAGGGFFGTGGVFLYSNGTLKRVVGPGDPSPDGGTFQFADAPSINANGDISFFAETSNFGFGAFIFHNGQFIQVAEAGDVINGIGLGFVDEPVLNNNGDLAFTASLFDGSNAIFVATNGANSDASWSSSTPGPPAATGELQWQKMKRTLLQLKDQHNHLGQNLRMVNQSN